MQKLDDWMNSEIFKSLKQLSSEEILTQEFFRDPFRSIFVNGNLFYSPADGIVLYSYLELDSKEKIVEVKGELFTLEELLDEDIGTSLVMGIFMTSFDVHINRVPITSVLISSKKKSPLQTYNAPMIPLETSLFKSGEIDTDNMGYLFMNERIVNKFYCPKIHQSYYIVQMADKEVDAISNWINPKALMMQGDRFGMVRWGSQVDLIVPLNATKYEILCEPMDHIEAGLDPLVKIMEK